MAETTFSELCCCKKHSRNCAFDIGDRGGRTGLTKTVGVGDGLRMVGTGLGFGEPVERTDGVGDGVATGIGVGVGLVLAMDPASPFIP